MSDEKMEDLTVDRLCSGDRPSVIIAGMVVSQSIAKAKMAVLMVDVLGRVVAMPPEAVHVLHRPKLSDEDLNERTEEEAIKLMDAEGRTDRELVEYLRRRDAQGNEVL